MKTISLITIPLAIVLTIAGCGGAEESTSSTSSSSSSSSSGITSQGNAKAGAESYQLLCIDCHAEPIFKNNGSITALSALIEDSMPFLRAEECVGSCALDVATYIAQQDPNFGNSNSSSSSSSGTPVAMGEVDPAPVTLHRLNRSEYNNTVRDLLHTELTPADDFPEDDFGYGFNNIANVLSVSLSHTENYMRAAEQLAVEAVGKALATQALKYEAENLTGTDVTPRSAYLIFSRSTSSVNFEYEALASGSHTLRIRAGQNAGGTEDANMVLSIDSTEIANEYVSAPSSAMSTYTYTVDLSKGTHIITIEFTNDYYLAGVADRDLTVDWIDIRHSDSSLSDNTIFTCSEADGELCARQTATEFGAKAWRRPLSELEITDLVGLFNTAQSATSSFKLAMESMIQSLLLSPNFLYRAEYDDNVESPTPSPLNPYELASRLSYFLWGSMPDQRLFELAANGTLHNESVLSSEVTRMLDSSEANTLIENFAVQWLAFDKVAETTPDAATFPDFNEQLVEAMRTETRLFLKTLLEDNAPVSDLFKADFTYLNEQLAKHYGIAGIEGDEFVPYQYQASDKRQGILGHGSVLTATSHPTVTSPVKRGVWVLEKLICKEPPPPPPGVENIADGNVQGLSTRQRFELHSDTSTVCYSCHSLMDPIGFALENYNPIGQWRDFEGMNAIDANGAFPDGQTFTGPLELSNMLGDGDSLPLCAIEHMMTYALGRGVEALHETADGHEPSDYPAVYQVFKATQADGHRLRDIIKEIVLSPAFRQRRGADSVWEH